MYREQNKKLKTSPDSKLAPLAKEALIRRDPGACWKTYKHNIWYEVLLIFNCAHLSLWITRQKEEESTEWKQSGVFDEFTESTEWKQSVDNERCLLRPSMMNDLLHWLHLLGLSSAVLWTLLLKPSFHMQEEEHQQRLVHLTCLRVHPVPPKRKKKQSSSKSLTVHPFRNIAWETHLSYRGLLLIVDLEEGIGCSLDNEVNLQFTSN